MMIQCISYDKNELSLDSSATWANGQSELEFSMSIKGVKYLPSISWVSQPVNAHWVGALHKVPIKGKQNLL